MKLPDSDAPLPLRTIFMGTPEMAVPSLRVLAARTQVVRVITQPDRPAGRGRKTQAPPVKIAAERLGLPVYQPSSLRADDGAAFADVDLMVVLAYGEILREPVLQAPRLGCINLHASLLPRWRGASPLQAAIRAGDTESGVSVMQMVRALDAGPVYATRRIILPPRVTLPWLHDALAEESAEALLDYLNRMGEYTAQPQPSEGVTYCGKLYSKDGAINWSAGVHAVDRQVRAYTPIPGCWSELQSGQRLGIQQLLPSAHGGPTQPGAVVCEEGAVLVGCGDGAVSLQVVQPPGKRPMDIRSFLNGHALPQQFIVPS
ncbi:MAG: methionyl-tRNA formyltransferase [Planctomycetota bacterium]|nr:MAG: methionyl-tRNA formyltransferase [Planctomycetota bacterium]